MKVYLRMAALWLSVLMLLAAVGCTEEPIAGSSSDASSGVLTSQQTTTSSEIIGTTPDDESSQPDVPVDSTSSADNSAKPKPTPEPTPAPAPKPTKANTVTLAGWWDLLPSADAASEKSRLQYFQLQEVMHDYNVNVEVIVVDKRDIVPNVNAAYLSGAHWADVVNMSYSDAYAMARQGRLMDITNLYDHNTFDYNQSVRKLMTINGKIYGFSQFERELESAIAFNKDIFDRQGLLYPYELVNNKQWTWDKFIEYVQRSAYASQAGRIETYGWYAKTDSSTISSLMYAAIGRQFVEVNSSGKYLNKSGGSDVADFLNKVRSLNLMEATYMPPSNVVTWSDAPEKFKAGKVAMMPCTTAGLYSALKDMNDDWGVVPMPTANAGGEYRQLYQTNNTVIVMPHLDKEWAKVVAEIYTKIYQNPYTESEYDEYRQTELEGMYRDMESIKMIQDYASKSSGSYSYMDLLGEVTDTDISYEVQKALNPALRGEGNLDAALNKVNGYIKKACNNANK